MKILNNTVVASLFLTAVLVLLWGPRKAREAMHEASGKGV